MSGLSWRERLELIKRNTVEIVTEEELAEKLRSGEELRGYLGFEPSGNVHVGWLVWMYKFRDLVEAGVNMVLFEATWHAWINDKLGGDMVLLRAAAKVVERVLEAVGVDMSRVEVVDAEELASDPNYWAKVLRIAKSVSLSRVKRALTIMGRRAEEAELDFSKLIYPLMQVADIFHMDLDIALGGLDQRKAHMLARDVAEKLGAKKPIAIHTPLITSLQGAGRMDVKGGEADDIAAGVKMSKSRPSTAIFLTDSDEEIAAKIRKAYCPPRQVEYNPVMEIARYIIFAEPRRELVIERPAKYGGTITVGSYEELEKLYVEGELHPLDLKNAVARELISLVRPIRERLLGDPDVRRIIEEVSRRVTR